jgi:hypothetical protein
LSNNCVIFYELVLFFIVVNYIRYNYLYAIYMMYFANSFYWIYCDSCSVSLAVTVRQPKVTPSAQVHLHVPCTCIGLA